MLLNKQHELALQSKLALRSSLASSNGSSHSDSEEDNDNDFDDEVWVAKVTHRATQHLAPEAVASLNIPTPSARRKIISGKSRISFQSTPPATSPKPTFKRIQSTTQTQEQSSTIDTHKYTQPPPITRRLSTQLQLSPHLEAALSNVISANSPVNRTPPSQSPVQPRVRACTTASVQPMRSVSAQNSPTIQPSPPLRSLPTSPLILENTTSQQTSTETLQCSRPSTAPTSRLFASSSSVSNLASSSASITSPSFKRPLPPTPAPPTILLTVPEPHVFSAPAAPPSTKPKPPPRHKLSVSAPSAHLSALNNRPPSTPSDPSEPLVASRLRSPSAPSAVQKPIPDPTCTPPTADVFNVEQFLSFHCLTLPYELVEKMAIKIQRRYRVRLARKKYKKMVTVYKFCSNVAKEIVETERTYVWILRYICQRYFEPLMKDVESVGVTADDVRTIFGGLSVIVNVNASLLESLEERMSVWSPTQCLGDLFLDMAPHLKSYSDYVKNFDLALRRMDECCKRSPKFEQFVRAAEEDSGVRVTLESHLIAPVQRVPRYALLLQQLFEKTPRDHMDSVNLGKALDKIKEVALYINEKKRESDNALRVVEIQSLLVGKPPTLISAQRRFCFEGELSLSVWMPVGEWKQKKRHCYLFNDCFVVTKPVIQKLFNNSKKKYRFCFMFVLAGAELCGEGERTFTIKTDATSHRFSTDKAAKRSEWTDLLHKTIKEQRDAERIYEERISRAVSQKAQFACDTITQQYSALALKEMQTTDEAEQQQQQQQSESSLRIKKFTQLLQFTKKDEKQKLTKSVSSPVLSLGDEEELTKILASDNAKEKNKLMSVLKKVMSRDSKIKKSPRAPPMQMSSSEPRLRTSVVGVVNMKSEVMHELVTKFSNTQL